jgi:hypothetical protein
MWLHAMCGLLLTYQYADTGTDSVSVPVSVQLWFKPASLLGHLGSKMLSTGCQRLRDVLGVLESEGLLAPEFQIRG